MTLASGIRAGLRSGLRSGLNPGSVPARGLPVPTTLASGKSSTDGTIFTSLAIAPNPGEPLIASFACRRSTTAPNVVATGCGLTWVQIATATISNIRTLVTFRAAGPAPTPGVVTFTCDQTQIGARWWIGQVAEADESGANGAGAVVQSKKAESIASGTTGSTTFDDPLEHPNNINLTAVMTALATASVVPDPQFTEIDDDAAAEFVGLEVQWARGERGCDPTWSTSTAAMISIEVKAA